MQVVAAEEEREKTHLPNDSNNFRTSLEDQNRHFNSKYSKNLEDANYRRWYDSMSKKSPQRAGVYHRTISRFCLALKSTPQAFAKLPLRKMEDIVMDFVSEMERKVNAKTGQEYSQKYIEKYTDAVKSWAEWRLTR